MARYSSVSSCLISNTKCPIEYISDCIRLIVFLLLQRIIFRLHWTPDNHKAKETKTRMKVVFIILASLSMRFCAGNTETKIDMEALIRRATMDLHEDLAERMKSGATSSRFAFKKITPM